MSHDPVEKFHAALNISIGTRELEAWQPTPGVTWVQTRMLEHANRLYDALPGHEQEAFRICRDLALLKTSEREPFTFYLSFNHLADRLGIFPMQAQRIMRQLEAYGLINLLKKGTRRAAGVRSEAGSYKWLISP
jgi:hypothetical protein